MRYLTLALAGTLIGAAGLTATPATSQSSLGVATRGSPHVSSVPPGAFGVRHIRRPPQISPHIGLPGISGFPDGSSHRDRHGRHRGQFHAGQISPHIGLPGISGFPDTSEHRRRHGRHRGRSDLDFAFWGYGDGDGYADTVPYPDQFGFFATGGEVTMDRDKPVYHYDRSYPYDWYGGPRTTGPRAVTSMHCQVRRVWDSEQRKDVEVQVCGAR